MAKKVFTPEEVKAKMEKKSAKRKLFFGTFTKALAFFLAIAMAYSLATIAFTPATVTATGGAVQSGEQAGGESTGGDDDAIDFGDSGSASTGDSGSASTGDNGSASTGDSGSASTGNSGSASTGDSGSSSGQQSTGVSKADAVKALNDATAKAAKASYNWERESYYTEPLNVDNKEILNKAIAMFDKNATIDSVVGGFLDITGEGKKMTATVTNGQLPDEGMKGKDKFLLIASSLTESDVKQYKVEGNTYRFQLNACNRPQKDGSNPLSKVTNDFITCDEVNAGLADAGASSVAKATDVDVTYKAILVVAEIVDGKLTKYDISYTMDVADMELKVLGMGVGGSGAGELKASYSNFKY